MISRVVDALMAAAATIAAVLGLTTLTENASWLGRATWACLAVAAVGVLLRRLTSFRLLVLFGQLVATSWAVVAMFAAGQLWYGLPGPDSWNRVVELATELRRRDAAVRGSHPRHRRGPVRPRGRCGRSGDPRRLPRRHRGDARGGGTPAARRLPHGRGQRRLVALPVVLRHRVGHVARARRPAGSGPRPALVDHRRQPANPRRPDRRREPGHVGLRERRLGSWGSSRSSRPSSCRRSSRTCRRGTSSTVSAAATAASGGRAGSASTRRSTSPAACRAATTTSS